MTEKKITAKQLRFAEEYLIDLNATQAAIRAGYSKKTAEQYGYQLLQKTSVQEAIASGRSKATEKAELSVAWVLDRLRTVAERCMQSEPVLGKRGEAILVETPDGELAPAFTFQAAPANRSLELLGKHLGMFPDKVEHTGKGGGPIQTEELGDTERARRIAFLLQQGLKQQTVQ
ncbi:MAG TPA: terminase small subunit [Ramlibacter sp.]